MKATSIRTIGLALSAMFITQHPFAQNTVLKNGLAGEVSYNSIKNNQRLIDESSVIMSPATIPYNEKVLTRFNKQFLNATNVNWSFATNGTWHAFFTHEGAPNSILYNKKGRIIYLINYVSEKQLPSDVKKLITNCYPEYQITDVAKVIQDERTIWIVNVASLNHLIALREEDGELEEVSKFKKAK
jgi:hypothetical protein